MKPEKFGKHGIFALRFNIIFNLLKKLSIVLLHWNMQSLLINDKKMNYDNLSSDY